MGVGVRAGSTPGRYGVGDRHVEMRAALAVHPSFPGSLAIPLSGLVEMEAIWSVHAITVN